MANKAAAVEASAQPAGHAPQQQQQQQQDQQPTQPKQKQKRVRVIKPAPPHIMALAHQLRCGGGKTDTATCSRKLENQPAEKKGCVVQ